MHSESLFKYNKATGNMLCEGRVLETLRLKWFLLETSIFFHSSSVSSGTCKCSSELHRIWQWALPTYHREKSAPPAEPKGGKNLCFYGLVSGTWKHGEGCVYRHMWLVACECDWVFLGSALLTGKDANSRVSLHLLLLCPVCLISTCERTCV